MVISSQGFKIWNDLYDSADPLSVGAANVEFGNLMVNTGTGCDPIKCLSTLAGSHRAAFIYSFVSDTGETCIGLAHHVFKLTQPAVTATAATPFFAISGVADRTEVIQVPPGWFEDPPTGTRGFPIQTPAMDRFKNGIDCAEDLTNLNVDKDPTANDSFFPKRATAIPPLLVAAFTSNYSDDLFGMFTACEALISAFASAEGMDSTAVEESLNVVLQFIWASTKSNSIVPKVLLTDLAVTEDELALTYAARLERSHLDFTAPFFFAMRSCGAAPTPSSSATSSSGRTTRSSFTARTYSN
jgi:hypothetical protein